MKSICGLKGVVLTFVVLVCGFAITCHSSVKSSTEGVSKTQDSQEVPEIVRKEAKRLFGKKVLSIGQKGVSSLTTEVCQPYAIYKVTLERPRRSGFGNRWNTRMAYGEKTLKLYKAEEVAGFLTSLKKPVSGELEVIERTVVFADLFGAAIVTHLPKRKSRIEKYAELKEEDWQLVISGTDSGWLVSVTLMRNRRVESSWRYDLEVSREGAISIVSERHVYQYAMLS